VSAETIVLAEERDGFGAAWTAVRDRGDIQFAPSFSRPDPPPPSWLKDFIDWLQQTIGPLIQALAPYRALLQTILLALLVLGVLTLLYVILRPYVEMWLERRSLADPPTWQPDAATARQLLEEADRLAALGQYDEAAHLLLYRSIEDIEAHRPDLVRVSDTSREIGRFEALSDAARRTFGVIAGHVERSHFARRQLDRAAWEDARAAYHAFVVAGG